MSLSVALFRFSLFVANSHTKRFTNIVLDLTYLRTECVSFVPSLASAQQLVVTLRSSKTYYCSHGFPDLCGYCYAALFSACRTLVRPLFSLSSPAGSLPGQRSFPSYGISCVLEGFLFIALKVILFASVPPLQPLSGSARLAD